MKTARELEIPIRPWVPDIVGIITVFIIIMPIAMLNGTYTGSMLVQHFAGYIEKDAETKTRDFFDMNIKLAYDIPLFYSVTLQVNAGIQNIFNAYQNDFDKGPYRDSGYIYGPSLPRSYFMGCKISY